MWPYYMIVGIILLLQNRNRTSSTEKYKYGIGMLSLFLFAALRGNGDGDYFTYLEYSKKIVTLSDVFDHSFPMEIGFRWISYFVNFLEMNSQWVIVIMNFIALFLVGHFIYKYSEDKLLSILLYYPLFLQFDMHATRTAVAIAITTVAFQYSNEGKWIKFAFSVFLAICFHQSALIFVILIAVRKVYLSNRAMIAIIAGSYIFNMLFSVDQVIYDLLRLMGLKTFATKYNIYMNSEEFGYAFKLTDIRLLLFIGILICVCIFLKKRNSFENRLVNCLVINILALLFFHEHTLLAMRLSSFFNIYTILLIPVIIEKIKIVFSFGEYKIRSMKIAMILTYLIYIYGLLGGYVEYKTFF